MNVSMLVPFFVVASAKKDRRSRLAEAMVPTMVPLPPAQMVAVAAISADAQVRREDRRVAAAQTELATTTAQLTAAQEGLEAALPVLMRKLKDNKVNLSEEEYGVLSKLEVVKASDKFKELLENIKPGQ